MSGAASRVRDPGLVAAIEAAGGVRPLARALEAPVSTVASWVRVPLTWLDRVAAATGIEAEILRPDQSERLAAEAQKRAIARARTYYGTAGVVRFRSAADAARETGVPAKVMKLYDFALTAMALSFAAEQFGLAAQALYAEPFGGTGAPSPAQRARTYGLALAVVALRLEPTAVARLVGTTKQNVQNAARRYLDARDGKDVSAGPPGDRQALWAAEQLFLEGVAR